MEQILKSAGDMDSETGKAVNLTTWQEESFQTFINHHRRSEEGNSVVFTDTNNALIAFFDRGTSIIQQVKGAFDYTGDVAISFTGEFGETLGVDRRVKSVKWVSKSNGSENSSSLLSELETLY